jgi:hypothetical protein
VPGGSKIKPLFNECADTCPSGLACKQSFLLSQQPRTVDANATGLVGMDNQLSTECYCDITGQGATSAQTCLNGGTTLKSDGGSDFYCQCPAGYNGPRCEFLSIQFRFSASSPSHSYALFKVGV